MIVVSSNGYSVNFEINTLNIVLKSSGVKAINLEQVDTVSSMNIYDPTQVKSLVFTKAVLVKELSLKISKFVIKVLKVLDYQNILKLIRNILNMWKH